MSQLILPFWVLNTILMIFNFSNDSTLEDWRVVNDGVMGGLSEGQMYINDSGHAVFKGTVSLDNNGGFTSIRYRFKTKSIDGQRFAILRIKGDGKRYQFRAKTSTEDYFSYIYYFQTSGEWETLKIPLGEMVPTFRGRTLDQANYPAKELSEIAILIANKKAESFALEIDHIGLE